MPPETNDGQSPETLRPQRTPDPHLVLGLRPDATEEQVRRRYLELVRQYPPEREPDRFREIHEAYKAAGDPLLQARHLIRPAAEPPEWKDVIEQGRRNPPRLGIDLLLSLGNQAGNQANDGSDE